MKAKIESKIKEIVSMPTLKLLGSTYAGKVGAGLLHRHAIGRIEKLSAYPELSDGLVMLGGTFAKGNIRLGILAGAGLSLTEHILARLGVSLE